jgi:hypothetical protein
LGCPDGKKSQVQVTDIETIRYGAPLFTWNYIEAASDVDGNYESQVRRELYPSGLFDCFKHYPRDSSIEIRVLS